MTEKKLIPNPEYLQRLQSVIEMLSSTKIIVIIAVLSAESAATAKGLKRSIEDRLKVSYGISDILSGLNLLEDELWMIEKTKSGDHPMAPYVYRLTGFGQTAAIFFEGMLSNLEKMDKTKKH